MPSLSFARKDSVPPFSVVGAVPPTFDPRPVPEFSTPPPVTSSPFGHCLISLAALLSVRGMTLVWTYL